MTTPTGEVGFNCASAHWLDVAVFEEHVSQALGSDEEAIVLGAFPVGTLHLGVTPTRFDNGGLQIIQSSTTRSGTPPKNSKACRYNNNQSLP